MESLPLDLAKNEVQSLVNLVKNEAQYLCCFNNYVENFEEKKNILRAKHMDVKRKFQKGKGVFSFKFEALQWESEADDIIRIDTKIKKKLFFGWCPNCWWKYQRGKELAEKTQDIQKLLERCNSNIVASRANVLDIKYLSSQGFIHFESRKSKFQDLLKALQDGNCNMIGLQGLGGTGKTSMAKEVGLKLKESYLIDKFIFLVVSQPPNFKKIRGELAKSLDLDLDKVKEEELSNTILSRITNMDQKLLIILDDVWTKFDFTEELGIPQKGCNLLITTRNLDVCTKMECQTIQLQILTSEEALNLFKAHANYSSRGLKGMPQKIVKHCGGVPVAIVALARSLKNQPILFWKDALKTLEDGGLDPNLDEAYKCLKLSYDNLKSQKAKELLLISSLFPEDFEIPIELLIKTGIGLGSFNENDKYHLIRSEVHGAIMELIHSSLLLNDGKECVKMHDLVREVALWIGENDMQSLLDLEKPIKGNLRYIFWKTNKFPNEIDGNKLEYLSIMLDDFEDFNVTDTFFEEMTSIKVLIVDNVQRDLARSLTNSLQPLKSVQTLILHSMILGDISALGNLSTLMTLWFYDCSIVELPKEFLKLKRLSSLEVEECKIKRNNPFEVIEMCSQLEELTFVCNECDDEEKDAISHNGSPLTLHRYCISSADDISHYSKKYHLSRCFLADECDLVSHATFKQLVERAEFLSLQGEDGRRMWKNLVPDIFPIDKQEGVMNDLIVLHLSSHPNMEYLIDTKDRDPSMSAFCNLAKLHLSETGIEDLCRGPPPSGFLEQLEILKLTGCHKLMSVFHPYSARSLIHMKKLKIKNCRALEYIIAGEDGDNNQKSYYDSLFPSLEKLELSRVPNFIGIVREYHQLMSSSRHKQPPPLSRHNSWNLNQSLATRAFSWVQACCSLNKLRPASEETNITTSEDRSLDHTNPLELLASKKWIDTAPTIVRQQPLLQVRHIRKMVLADLSINSVSKLFTLSMASMISWEELEITRFDGLKHLVTSEDDDYKEQSSCHSIFPKLKNLKIRECEDLKFLFLSSISIEIKNLKSLTIGIAPKLTHVVGKYQHHHCISNLNQNDEFHFDLPALEALSFEDVPEFITIVYSYEGNLNSNTTKKFDASTDRGSHSLPAQSLLLQSLKNVREIRLLECHNIISLSTLSIATSTIALETLTIRTCHKLKCITTHEGDAQVDRNYCAIFPTLEKLEITDCKELEFLFVSAISVGLQKLKSLYIEEVPKLKCVFGNYQKEEHSSKENQTDELHFDLPALESIYIDDASKMNGIFAKNYSMVNWTATEKFDASTDRGSHSLPAQSLLLQSLKNVREIRLLECHNIISLSTLSIATSTIALETLAIRRCHKLKCITTHEGDAQVDRNYCAIFPTLEKLEITDCKELEFLFVSAISVGLQKLKSLYIEEVPKLKCVFGNYQKEEHSSKENQTDELHFDLPALESIYIDDASKMNGIFAKNYSMVNWTATEEVHASTIGAPLFHVTQNHLKNIREIKLVECTNLISLTTLSSASIIMLEVLTIRACDQLKCIVGDEGDARTQINYNSIFPKLKWLKVSDCDSLEYLFPAYAFRSPVSLESLEISWAPMLEYVFGRTQHDDSLNSENQNIQTHIDFPALKDFSIVYMPKLVSIYPENYYMRGLYLRSVILKKLPEFTMRHFNEFLICWHTEQQETKVIEMCLKTLESLQVCDFKIEEIFDLTHMETEKKGDELQPLTSSLKELKLLNLSKLVSICVGPKCIIRFDSLWRLNIEACKKLRVIFSASIVRSLPMLKVLDISECEELVHIVEEDYETNADDHVRHEPCFPNLYKVSVSHCDKLKYLFSITISNILPKLFSLYIYNAYELEHVLIKRDEMEEIVMKDVLPQQCHLQLINLPNLISVCHGINFQKEDYSTAVYNCPKFGTSTTQHQADLETGNSQVEEKAEERLSSHMGEEITQQSFTKVVEARAEGVSTSLNQAPSSILSKSSDDDDVQVYDKSHPHSTNLFEGVDHGDIKEAGMVPNEYNSNVEPSSLTRREQESSYSKGQIQTKDQLTDSQPISAMPTTHFVTISQDEHSESDKELNPIAVNRTDSQKASSKDELEGKVARNERIKIDPQQSTMDTQNFTKDELVGKEVQKETIMMEPQSQQETIGHDIHFHKEEEREDGVQLPNKSQSLAIDSSGSGNLVPNITHPINSLEGVNNEGINEASVVQNESKTNVTCRGDHENLSNITQIEQAKSHSRGRKVESRDCAESDFIEDTKLSVSPFYTPIEMMPSFLETNNEASIVPGVQEIIHMMKLEGFESLIFAKALETRPQLQLSTKDRSARVLCMSYRVLLDILNILTTKTPFTITEADKRLLAEHLKDAYLLGFDMDWIESIKTKVFDSGIFEVDSIQKVLKVLDNDLKSNEAMLEAIRDEEVKASRVVEVAQQEHADVMARHAHLLKERQDIIARRHQCWEIISAKNRHFGF